MTPREYIETAMKLAKEYRDGIIDDHELEAHLRNNLDEIIEDAYDQGREDGQHEGN
jgi:hypothetical protein